MRYAEKPLLGGLFCLYVAAFFPGFLTPDPLWQLMQIRGVSPMNNWHPPAITAIWHVIDKVFENPAALFLIQELMLFHSAVVVARAFQAGRGLRLIFLAVLLCLPPVMANFALMWKDNWFVLFLIYGFAYALAYERRGRTRDFVLSCLGCVLALLTRFNGFIAALPLLGFVCMRFVGRRWPAEGWAKRLLRAGALMAALFAVVVVVSGVLERHYVKKHYASWQIIPLYDLVGISVNAHKLYLPGYIERGEAPDPAPTLRQLEEIYEPHTSDGLVWRGDDKYRMPVPNEIREFEQTPQQRSEIVSAWFHAVFSEPLAYLEHRTQLFKHHLGVGRQYVCAPYHVGIHRNVFGWTFTPRQATHFVYLKIDPIANSFIFRGYFYLFALMGLGVAWWFTGRSGVGLALWVSSLGLLLSNYFLLGACDFRYLLWPVVGSVLLGFLLLAELIRARRARS